MRDCTIYVVKTNALISYALTVQLISALSIFEKQVFLIMTKLSYVSFEDTQLTYNVVCRNQIRCPLYETICSEAQNNTVIVRLITTCFFARWKHMNPLIVMRRFK